MLARNEYAQLGKGAALESCKALSKLLRTPVALVDAHAERRKITQSEVSHLFEDEGIELLASIKGDLSGVAIISLPKSTAFDICDLLFGLKKGSTRRVTPPEQSALKELGNILFGRYLAGLSPAVHRASLLHTAVYFISKEAGSDPAERNSLRSIPHDGVLAFSFVFEEESFRGSVLCLFDSREIQALKESKAEEGEECRASFVELNPNPVVILDRLGHVIYCNAASYLRFPDLFRLQSRHPAVEGALEKMLNISEHGKEVVVFAYEMTYAKKVYEQYLFAPQGTEGVFIYMTDITERKHAEEKLARYAEDLKKSNIDLERFASITSHDLQEPLRVAKISAQLFAKKFSDIIDEEGRGIISTIEDNTDRMMQLVQGILEYSRIGKQESHSDYRQVDCQDVLKDVERNLRERLLETKATVTHDPLPTVYGHPIQLLQLFQNIVDNAIKFRGKNPPKIHISAKQQGQEWIFSVQDNGIGFEMQYQDRIFDIFKRLHTSSQYPGTGVGLATCKKIVEQHGGKIWAESQPGNGSTFFFTVPMVQCD